MLKKIKKIAVGFPPTESEKGTPLLSQNRQFQYFHNETFLFPVVLATGATMFKANGYDVEWLDAIAEHINEEEFYKKLEKEKYDLFFFETKAPVVKKHWKQINKIKERFPEMKIVICGDHVTALPYETMAESKVDYLICGGYYDFACLELVEALNKGREIPKGVWYRKNGEIIPNGKYDFKGKLDDAPIVDRILTKNHLYQKEFNLKGRPLAYIMSGRDCWYGLCTFCVWDMTLYSKGNFRARTPENVFQEVKYLVDECGVKEVFDDAGTLIVGNWLKKFCKLMVDSGYNKKVMYSGNMRFGAVNLEEYKMMKEAGFRLLKYGLESGEQKTIDKLVKGTKINEIEKSCREAKEAGLTVHLTMMVGYPWESKQEALKTYKLAKGLMTKGYADVLQSTIIVPYPGTPLYREGIEKNWFRFDPKDYERLDMAEPIFKVPEMTVKEIQGLCNKIYNIFWDPRYVYQVLKKIRTLDDVKFVARGVKAVVGHMLDFSRPLNIGQAVIEEEKELVISHVR